MAATAQQDQGHANRKQGFYGECVVQAIAASAGLTIAKEDPEPEGVDLIIAQIRQNAYPKRRRIEVQVKSRSNPKHSNGAFQVQLKAKAYHELNGVVGRTLDLARYLILVTVPEALGSYYASGSDHIKFHHQAYWANLMGKPDLPPNQASVTVSVPELNILTSAQLVALICGDHEEASQWMSA